ncbi:hypothetical protein FA95DRAFT_1554179 [Auriscalpium vulgare]|uniref:Uncharacterized protein n=1 Tax=Auriscalpium vulgare TaxID=40419 RepID=A0ACB8S525_9AGAM|nr:hypothetical protein FA95DRAFT_1554179 [Auriscalpium vulgare]
MVRGQTHRPNLKFVHPEYFSQLQHNRRFYCTLCTPEHRASVDSMTFRQAVKHENCREHLSRVSNDNPWDDRPNPADWNPDPSKYTLYDDLRVLERQQWVDLSPDLVAFWRRGMEAAERGEQTERMQEFLEQLEAQKGAARRADDAWNQGAAEWAWGIGSGDPWAQKAEDRGWGGWTGWGAPPKAHSDGRGSSGLASDVRDLTGSSAGRQQGGGTAGSSNFVDEFVRLQDIDSRRKEKMRTFFEASLAMK